MSEPVITAIIPCKGDAGPLDRLLKQLGRDDRVAVIVVKPGEDATVRTVADRHGAKVLAVGAPRGGRLKVGADAAKTDILWFLHADALPPEEAVDHIITMLDEPSYVGGYFQFRFNEAAGWVARCIEWGVALRCATGGTPYGDQGLFCRRAAYAQSGGHGPDALFEEVPLVKGLRRLGHFAAAPAAMGIDPRRWQSDGFALRTFKNRIIAVAFGLGVSPQRLARWYVGRQRLD